MKWPTSRQLTIMRETIEETLPETFTLSELGSATVDSWGEQTTSYSTVATGVRGAFAPAGQAGVGSAAENLIGGGVSGLVRYVLTFEDGTVVRPGMRAVAAARGAQASHTFEVVGALPISDELAVRVYATERV